MGDQTPGVDFMKSTRLAVLAALSSLFAIPAALADSGYNGTWVVDVPPAEYNAAAGEYSCPALRFPLKIQNGRVTGQLEPVPSSDPGLTVEAGRGRDSAPVTGSVEADGTVTASWLDYHANGRLSDAGGTVTIDGECGPRQATVYRIN